MKCFYHKVDFDGQCSGAIIKYKYSDTELFPINYDDVFPFELITDKDEIVFLVDYSLKPNEMLRLRDLCKLIWIDHHKSANSKLAA